MAGSERIIARTFSLVEPFVEIKHVRFFCESDLFEPGPAEQIDELAGRQVCGMGVVARPFDGLMVGRTLGEGVGRVVADDENPSGTQQFELPSYESRRINHVM